MDTPQLPPPAPLHPPFCLCTPPGLHALPYLCRPLLIVTRLFVLRTSWLNRTQRTDCLLQSACCEGLYLLEQKSCPVSPQSIRGSPKSRLSCSRFTHSHFAGDCTGVLHSPTSVSPAAARFSHMFLISSTTTLV